MHAVMQSSGICLVKSEMYRALSGWSRVGSTTAKVRLQLSHFVAAEPARELLSPSKYLSNRSIAADS
jgi:hypothetical protein